MDFSHRARGRRELKKERLDNDDAMRPESFYACVIRERCARLSSIYIYIYLVSMHYKRRAGFSICSLLCIIRARVYANRPVDFCPSQLVPFWKLVGCSSSSHGASLLGRRARARGMHAHVEWKMMRA